MHEPRGSTRPVFNPFFYSIKHLGVLLLPICKKPTFRIATTGIPAKRRLRNEPRNPIPMTRYHPDLGSTSDWSPREENIF